MINEIKLAQMEVEAEAKVQKLWESFMQQFSSPSPDAVTSMLPKTETPPNLVPPKLVEG